MRRLALTLILLSSSAMAADDLALPDPIMTPGAVDPAVTIEVICNRTTKERRNVSTAIKLQILAAYNIPEVESVNYEIDHLVPLAIGGANVVANLWPQPWVEAERKDACEREMQRRVCHGIMGLGDAQKAIAEDWVRACR